MGNSVICPACDGAGVVRDSNAKEERTCMRCNGECLIEGPPLVSEMNLRDACAIAALAGMRSPDARGMMPPQKAALYAYELADAMMRARLNPPMP